MARYNTDGSNALKPDDSNDDSGNFQVINSGKPQKDHFTESWYDFNPYYAPDYDKQNQNNNKNSKKNKSKNEQKNSNSKSLLRRAENSSLNPISQNRTDSPWQNNVQGKPINIPGPKGIKVVNGNKKRSIALIAIIVLLIGGGIFLSSTHSLLPAALESLLTEATDTQYASNTARIVVLTSYMLQADNNAIKTDWKGTIRFTRMSSAFKTRLTKNGITFDGSGKNTILNFKQTGTDGVEHITSFKADEFAQYYKNNPDFRNAYIKAKRGRVAGFFDNVANRVMTRLGLNRNVWKDTQDTNNRETNTENYNKVMASQADGDSSSVEVGGYDKNKPVYETDEKGNIRYDTNGNPIQKTTTDAYGNVIPVTEVESEKTNAAGSNVRDPINAEGKASSYISNAVSSVAKYTKALNTICTFRKIGNMIAAVASATELYNNIKIAAPFGESISKMKAGYGTSSAINESMTALTTSANVEIEDYVSAIASGASASAIGKIMTSGAAVEDPTLLGILSGTKINPSDAANYSIERTGSAVTSFLKMGSAELEACNAVRVGNAVVSIVLTVGSFGVTAIGSYILNTAVSIGVSTIASTALQFLIPTLAKVLFTNPWETIHEGKPLGALIVSGIYGGNSRLGRSGSGQSPSSKDAILSYNKITNEVLAMDAEIDRLNRSPFDITSKNTFLGSIAYSLLPSVLSSGTNTIQTIFRTTSKSIASLTGSAYAEGEGTSYITTFGNCPVLNALGVEGDVFCNPITTTDDTTINISPDDITYINAIKSQVNCEDDGTCHINDGNTTYCNATGSCELARYIKYCTERDSPYGIYDTGILSELETGNIVLNAIPLIGDIIDIANSVENELNDGWGSGQTCSNNPEKNTRWNDEIRYYQRYVQDMRLLDQIGEGENPVTGFLDEYYKEHPLDNSPAGYIARISGISKEDAENIIAIAEGYQFIQNYDPSDRIAMITENTSVQPANSVIARFDESKLNFSNSSASETKEEIYLAKQSEQYIIYADIRNRSYAA